MVAVAALMAVLWLWMGAAAVRRRGAAFSS